LGMMEFYSSKPKCLGCRRAMSGQSEQKDLPGNVPALCDVCVGVDGKWQEVYLTTVHEAACLEGELSAAYSACRSCHSGLSTQPVACSNGECPVTYVKMGNHAKLEAVSVAFKRLDLQY